VVSQLRRWLALRALVVLVLLSAGVAGNVLLVAGQGNMAALIAGGALVTVVGFVALGTVLGRIANKAQGKERNPDRGAGSKVPQHITPHQLPADVAGFTGRHMNMRELDAALDPAPATTKAVGILVLSGEAGAGKTALALHWAHSIADRFPDGQLYVDLRGFSMGPPANPGDVLAGFLRALGVEGASIPFKVDERGALYRSLLAGRRVLVVLDNARSSEQIKLLLPGTPSCLVLVTSRDNLGSLVALAGARRMELSTLSDLEAFELLRTLVGPQADAEPAACNLLARRCANLPLALRIAADIAVVRRSMTISALAQELADEHRALKRLETADDPAAAINTVFSWSYRLLPANAAMAFRLMGVAPGQDIGVPAISALSNLPLEEAEDAASALLRLHLVREDDRGRFALHDLVRAYAAEQIVQGSDDCDGALSRLFSYYLSRSLAAIECLFPADRNERRQGTKAAPDNYVFNSPNARSWLDLERPNLVALVEAAALAGWPLAVASLATVIWRYLHTGAHYVDAVRIHNAALKAARHAGDGHGEASALDNLGIIYWSWGRYGEAREFVEAANAIFVEIDSKPAITRTLSHLGMILARTGPYEGAIEYFAKALALAREIGDQYSEGSNLDNIGTMYEELGRYEEALSHYDQALIIARAIGNPEHGSLDNLGRVSALLGRYDRALDYLKLAHAVASKVEDRRSLGPILNSLGEVYSKIGDQRNAAENHSVAADVSDAIGDLHEKARAYRGWGDALQASGSLDEARQRWLTALSIYEQLGVPEVDQVRSRLSAATT
jgi:tetratricopeptide (TPR) repeat protein